MPSLSTKQEPVAANDPTEFSKSMVVMMEKKIRNLEKRKGKLEDYRAKQNKGETLNEEQLKAVAKLDDVLSQIELLQDLIKQFTTHSIEVAKQQKRQQKKDRFEQIENERRRFADVLELQSVLNALGAEDTRQAFVDGTDGAVKLEESELNHLDELFKIINPERGVDESLKTQIRTSVEHLQLVLDARDKNVIGTTYKALHQLITKIKNCSYFSEPKKSSISEDPATAEGNDTSTEKEYVMVKSEELPHADSAEVQSSLPPELPPQPLPTDPNMIASEQQAFQQPAVVAEQPKTFEKIVENVQGRFNFIQDSEIDLDSPSHVDPAVVSVHQMPAQQQYQQASVNHSQQSENQMYSQQQAAPDASYQQQQYNNMQQATYQTHDAPKPIPLPSDSQYNKPAAANTHAEDGELNFENGPMTFESTAHKQQQQEQSGKPHHMDDYQQQQRGPGRRGGGYRGNRGGQSNGYGERRGGGYNNRGGYRGDRGGHRDGDRGGHRDGDRGGHRDGDRGGHRDGDRGGHRDGDRGGDRYDSPSGNGYGSERRGGRGGSRGGGYRGGPSGGRGGRGGGSRGAYRGGQQNQQHQSASAQH